MSEEVVYNVDQGARICDIFCNWCLQTFEYREKGDHAIMNTSCPWCHARLTIPRNRLRRINGAKR
jgi:hypothetical protein